MFRLWWSNSVGVGRMTKARRPPEGTDWEAIHEFEAPVNAEAGYVFDKWVASGFRRPWPSSAPEPALQVEWSKTDTCWQCEGKIGPEAFTAAVAETGRMVFCCSDECRNAVQVRKALQ